MANGAAHEIVKKLEVERLFWIIQVGPKYNHKGPPKREAGSHKGRRQSEVEVGATWPGVKKAAASRNWQGMDSLLEPPKGASPPTPCGTDFALLASKTVGE